MLTPSRQPLESECTWASQPVGAELLFPSSPLLPLPLYSNLSGLRSRASVVGNFTRRGGIQSWIARWIEVPKTPSYQVLWGESAVSGRGGRLQCWLRGGAGPRPRHLQELGAPEGRSGTSPAVRTKQEKWPHCPALLCRLTSPTTLYLLCPWSENNVIFWELWL